MGLRVLHVEMGRHLYGGALQVFYLLRGLAERGYENILVCQQGSKIQDLAHGIARIKPIECLGDPDPRLLWHLLTILRTEAPDIFHVHSRRGADFWGALAARLTRARAVITRRVDNPEPVWMARWRYGSFVRVITISEGIKKVLMREGIPEEKISCVLSAIDVDHYARQADRDWFAREFSVSPKELAVGMVAQFIPRKGHQLLVAAARGIISRRKDVRFVLCGRGPLEKEIRDQVVRWGLEGHFIFAGFREDLPRILPCFDLLVHPAFMEGLGVGLVQAAAAGVPIVASRAGGIPEIVQHGVNGLLVPPGDVRALEEAIMELLDDGSKRKKMAQAGRRIARERFSLEKMIEGNIKVYESLIHSR